MTDASIGRDVRRLRGMTVGELREEWFRLYGEPTRSRNRDYLWKRLAWRVQELALGGLSDRARARIDELAPAGFERARTPAMNLPVDVDPPSPAARHPRRDPRLPVPGSVISKPYRGRELRVIAREDGYEFDGIMFPSLTAIAKQVTGATHINGKLFFGLTGRKR